MATAGDLREWLELFREDAEIVVWHEDDRERPILATIHQTTDNDADRKNVWDRGILVAGPEQARVLPHPVLRAVE